MCTFDLAGRRVGKCHGFIVNCDLIVFNWYHCICKINVFRFQIWSPFLFNTSGPLATSFACDLAGPKTIPGMRTIIHQSTNTTLLGHFPVKKYQSSFQIIIYIISVWKISSKSRDWVTNYKNTNIFTFVFMIIVGFVFLVRHTRSLLHTSYFCQRRNDHIWLFFSHFTIETVAQLVKLFGKSTVETTGQLMNETI